MSAHLAGRRTSGWVTFALVAVAAAIAVLPMFVNVADPAAEEDFGGTDGAAEGVVAEVDPAYEVWAAPLVGELPGEVESGLFALQAAIGSGIVFYVIGWYRGRNRGYRDAGGPNLGSSGS